MPCTVGTGVRAADELLRYSLLRLTGLGRPQRIANLREQNALSKKFTEASQLGLRMKLWVFRIV